MTEVCIRLWNKADVIQEDKSFEDIERARGPEQPKWIHEQTAHLQIQNLCWPFSCSSSHAFCKYSLIYPSTPWRSSRDPVEGFACFRHEAFISSPSTVDAALARSRWLGHHLIQSTATSARLCCPPIKLPAYHTLSSPNSTRE